MRVKKSFSQPHRWSPAANPYKKTATRSCAFVRSHVEGIAFHKQNKEFALKVLTKYVRTSDTEFLEGSYNLFKQDFIAAPYPIIKGLEPTYDYVAQTRPDIRSHKPEEFVDASFITELDKSGFIQEVVRWQIDMRREA